MLKINETKRIKNILKKIIYTFLALTIIPSTAFAGTTEVGRIVGALCGWLSGEVGAAVAVLAVIYSGYEMLSGDIDKKNFAVRCIAIGIIIGGSTITTSVLGVS